ncbi:hypothetical protein YB2330_001398 [Saitoella coloradoensis]
MERFTKSYNKYKQTLGLILPTVPLLTYEAFSHFTWGNQPNAWDFRSHMTIKSIKYFMQLGSEYTVEQVQKITTRESNIPHPNQWIINQPVPLSGHADQVKDAVNKACTALGEGLDKIDAAEVAAVDGEWTAYRTMTADTSDWSAEKKFAAMQSELESDAVVLYLHGGAYYLCSPVTHRDLVSTLARQFKGKCFSLKYRLAPQAPFPSQITDALLAYMWLIDPPAGALHKPVPPEKIVIAGDSAGGGLTAGVLLTILQSGLPRPAGVITLSPWVDLSHSFESSITNAVTDYLPELGAKHRHKASKAWAADGSQYHFYAANKAVIHPLVSPVTAKSWEGAPPMLVIIGEGERLRDEGLFFAQQAAQSGVDVDVQLYEAMPHVFQLLRGHPSARRSFVEMGKFVIRVTGGTSEESGARHWIDGRGEISPLADEQYRIGFTRDVVIERIRNSVEKWGSQEMLEQKV